MKLRSIQILRGIAAMAVVAHHAIDSGTPLGAAGVDLFFVISGFIMATCAGDRRPGEFLRDRAWRIYPVWLIALAPWLAITPQTPLEIIRSITLWPIYGDRFLTPALGVGWTLSFELIFYIGFALALATRPIVPLIVFGICLTLGLATRPVLFWFLGSPLTFEFLMGVAIARLTARQWPAMVCIGLAITWFALAPTEFYNQAFGVGAVYRVLAWGIPAAMLLYGIRSIEPLFAGRCFELPVLIGSASYSIYLFHQLVMLGWHGAFGFGLSVLAGIAIYLALERPIMRARPGWKKTDRANERAVQSAASVSLRT